MTLNLEALAWATLIIVVALLTKEQGFGSEVAFGIVAGLTGAAIGAMNGTSLTCRKGPLL